MSNLVAFTNAHTMHPVYVNADAVRFVEKDYGDASKTLIQFGENHQVVVTDAVETVVMALDGAWRVRRT
jgi:hypothetical protein